MKVGGHHVMTERSEVVRMRSAEAGNAGLDDRIPPRVGSEEIDAPETGWEEGQPPSTDEIRPSRTIGTCNARAETTTRSPTGWRPSPSCGSGAMPAVPPSGEMSGHDDQGETVRIVTGVSSGRRQRRPSG